MTALRIRNGTPPTHEFNFDVIGVGQRCPNLPVRETEVRVSMPVVVARDLLAPQVHEIECVVDTGSSVSLFSGKIAEELDLRAPQTDVHCEDVGLAVGTAKVMFVSQTVAIRLGSNEFFEIPVYFPVQWAGTRYVWDSLEHNHLGMRGVLGRRVLCFTPEALFVFCRTPFLPNP